MHCPFCLAVDTKVIDSRLVGEGSSVRRRRQCLVCNERFTTFEVFCQKIISSLIYSM